MSNEFINIGSANSSPEHFQLRYISISKYEGDWQSLPHTHHFSELFYVLRGEGAFYIENEKVPVKTDDLVIINPYVEHTEKTLPNDPMEYIVFGVDGLAFSFSGAGQDNPKGYSFYSYGSDKKQFINFAQLMMQEFRDKLPGFEQVCHGLLQVLLVYISRKQNLSVISDSSFQLSKECALAKRYIDSNYSQNITLDSLAEITHINKFYLAHSFTECVGQSPINYLTDRRLEACKELNRYGVTSSQTDDYCVYRSIPYSEVNEAYKELEAEGKLTVRVYEQCNFTEPEQLRQFLADGNMTGKGTDHFKIGPLKLLGDGALGGRTAYLSKGYADDPDNHGFPLFSKETMQALVSCANAAGMQIATHAIGDACLDMVLDCYENALKEHPRTDHRHGIVHCQASRADQLERIEKMNLHVYAQSIFLDYDNHIVEQRLGKELASTSYNWKTLKDHGVSVSNGTDCPVELPDALAGMQCAVTRTSLHDHVGPYLPEQAFSVKEALDSYTIESAKGSFEEKVKGRIAPGYLADFVVLGENLFTIPHDAIKDVPVLATYVGGECVYKK